MRFCYTDFAFTVLDYFSVIKKREIVFEWVIPLAVALGSYYYGRGHFDIPLLKELSSSLTNIFAIIVGFTTAAIAIFTATDVSKHELLDKKMPDRQILNNPVSTFRFVYVNLIFSAISGLTMLILTLASLVLSPVLETGMIFAVLIFGTLMNIFLAIRNTTNLYFIFFRR